MTPAGRDTSQAATTIAAASGLPYEKEFEAPNGRPFKIGGGGKPIAAVLA